MKVCYKSFDGREFNHEDDFFEALMEVCKYIEVEIDDKGLCNKRAE